MKLTRQQLRRVLDQEKQRILSERVDEEYKSEFKEFSETKAGSKFMQAGSKIVSAGRALSDLAYEQTGKTRKAVSEIATFVEKLGTSLSELNSLNETDSITETMPTVAEFKRVLKELQRLEK